MNTEHCIDICNGLLRGERSAVETYDQALEKYREELAVLPELTRIRSDHAAAVRELEANVLSMGGTPDETSGAWGSVAVAVQGTANLFGAGSALESLQQGEKAGEHDYEKALEDDEVMTECKSLIQTKLLPTVQEHVVTLEALQEAA
jgi:uncharacterized protein (TIGR02284 family)